MTTEESVITAAMKETIGVESEPITHEVEKGAIIKFAQAIGDRNPAYPDVAPPTFLRSVGRAVPDLPGGDGHQILVSIRDKLLTLDDDTEVTPGHGPATTIGREREFNYFLRTL